MLLKGVIKPQGRDEEGHAGDAADSSDGEAGDEESGAGETEDDNEAGKGRRKGAEA